MDFSKCTLCIENVVLDPWLLEYPSHENVHNTWYYEIRVKLYYKEPHKVLLLLLFGLIHQNYCLNEDCDICNLYSTWRLG
jgi:hypothetical protein